MFLIIFKFILKLLSTKNHIKSINNLILITFQMESYIFYSVTISNENIGRSLNNSIILSTGGDLMYIYSTGSWGIVITVEKCLHLCWAHAACVAVIYQLDGRRCELKQSCTVVTGGDVTTRAMLVEQKIDSSLTAITDGDNATCAAGTICPSIYPFLKEV